MKFRQNWFKQEVTYLLSVTHKLINSNWNKKKLPDQWKETSIVPVHKNRWQNWL
jgi:hypothetical protein